MPWSAGVFTRTNGTYTGPTTWQQDFTHAVKITYAHHDYHDQDLAGGINACLNKNGQNSPTTNINWGGFKITNLAAGASSGDSARYGQTVTALAIDPSSKILTATRADGDLTVDLTPIVVAGDTSDFARQSLDNTFAGTNDFTGAVNFSGASGQQTRWVFDGVARLNAYADTATSWVAYDNASVVPALKIDMSALSLSVYGSTVWTSGNLPLSSLLKTTDNATITGAWTFSTGASFTAQAQFTAASGIVLAGAGYSWAFSTPSPTVLQLASSGGNFLKVSDDAVHTSKLETNGVVYWNNANMQFRTDAPTGGESGDIAFVASGADKGVWANLAPGGWTKIAS